VCPAAAAEYIAAEYISVDDAASLSSSRRRDRDKDRDRLNIVR
jgi:hypothetical protein